MDRSLASTQESSKSEEQPIKKKVLSLRVERLEERVTPRYYFAKD